LGFANRRFVMDSIGECLRNAREERKIPIAQVARDTKIRERYIAAMEAGDFSVMPARAYARGFVRMYAEYLGIDPHPLIEKLSREERDAARSVFAPEEDTPAAAIPWRRILRGAAAVVLIVSVALSVVQMARSCEAHRSRRAAPVSEELETLPIPVVPTLEPAETPAAAAPAAKEEVAKKTLTARAKESVWMKVYADGSLLFQGTVRKGREETWTARETFDLRVGKPRSVELSLGGKALKELRSSEAQNLSIDRDGKVTFYKGKLRAE